MKLPPIPEEAKLLGTGAGLGLLILLLLVAIGAALGLRTGFYGLFPHVGA